MEIRDILVWHRGVGGLALRARQRTCQPPHAPLCDRPGSALVGLGLVFSSCLCKSTVHAKERQPRPARHRTAIGRDRASRRPRESRRRPSPIAAEESPPSRRAKRPKMTLLAALRQAIVQAWTGHGPAPVAEAPTERGGRRKPDQPRPAATKPPAARLGQLPRRSCKTVVTR